PEQCHRRGYAESFQDPQKDLDDGHGNRLAIGLGLAAAKLLGRDPFGYGLRIAEAVFLHDVPGRPVGSHGRKPRIVEIPQIAPPSSIRPSNGTMRSTPLTFGSARTLRAVGVENTPTSILPVRSPATFVWVSGKSRVRASGTPAAEAFFAVVLPRT